MQAKREEKPEFIGWGITERCNLSCPHCYSFSTKSAKEELSTVECLEVVDKLVDLGVKIIGWTGGEPLLRKDLEALISYAKNKGKIVSGITTNGILLDEKRAKNLKEAGTSFIQISLDGSTPEKNKRMRDATESDFWKIIEAIRICKRFDIRIDLAMLLGKENLDDAPNFIKLAEDEEVDSVRFCGFVPWGGGKNENVKTRLILSEKLEELKDFIENNLYSYSPVVMFDPAFGPLPPDYFFHPCVSGVKTFYLSSNGDVYPCTSLIMKKFLVGNLRENSLEDLWNNPKMTEVSSFPKEKIKGECKKCQYFERCKGGCRGITFAYTNDLFAPYPLCLNRA